MIVHLNRKVSPPTFMVGSRLIEITDKYDALRPNRKYGI